MSGNGPDTVLKLGDIQFSRFEVPEKIAFGGSQMLVVQKRVGGARTIDAMGRDDMPLEWTGWFIGENALARARALDRYRIAGKTLNLSWSQFDYAVVVRSFSADFERAYQLPYRISCEIVRENSGPPRPSIANGVDGAIRGDMTTANVLGAQANDSALNSALGSLNTAIEAVSDFAKATQSTINTVLQPLADVQARVHVLTTSVGNVLNTVTTVGGILPNNPVAQQATKLTQQVTAMESLPGLYNLNAVLGRMDGNLGTINSGTKTVTVAGGNLQTIAQTQYGDANEWPTLANANGMDDPQINGFATITVPANGQGTDGVLTT